jgi:glycine/D-amino acid oxidase-like deaminating enzyme
MTASSFDLVTVGGGLMGCVASWYLARGGMKVAVVDRGGLCMGASGVNAGTLAIQIKRAALVPYALRAWELWRTTAERFGIDVGFAQKGGLTLAFTDDEAAMMEQRMSERRVAGAPIEFLSGAATSNIEPGIAGERVVLASHCPMDGYANSSIAGRVYREALVDSGAAIYEGLPVTAIEREGSGFAVHREGGDVVRGRRVVLAGGAWMKELAAMLGVDLPIGFRVNQVAVTERMPQVVDTIVGVASGLLTLKQSSNGSVLIGGGWQGIGDLERGGHQLVPENLIGNLRLAQYAAPALAEARVVRVWMGLEGHVPDMMPLVGDLPGVPDAYIIGCVRGGFTISPLMGKLLAQHVLGAEPDMPIFDPSRPMHAEPDGQAAESPTGGVSHGHSRG